MQLTGHLRAHSTLRATIPAMRVPGTLPIVLALATMQRVRGIALGAVKG